MSLLAHSGGLPHEVVVLRLNVLSKHRILHESTCHSVIENDDPFATWRVGDGLFNKVTKTWIYQPDGNDEWISHSSNTIVNAPMGWNNIPFPNGCTY